MKTPGLDRPARQRDIPLFGSFTRQYTLEEIEVDLRAIHPTATVSVGEAEDPESERVPFVCTIMLVGVEASLDERRALISAFESVESVEWGSEGVAGALGALTHEEADELAQRVLGDMDPYPGEGPDEYRARLARARAEFAEAHPNWR